MKRVSNYLLGCDVLGAPVEEEQADVEMDAAVDEDDSDDSAVTTEDTDDGSVDEESTRERRRSPAGAGTVELQPPPTVVTAGTPTPR